MRQEVEAIAAMEEQAAQLANRRAALAAQVIQVTIYTILQTIVYTIAYTHSALTLCLTCTVMSFLRNCYARIRIATYVQANALQRVDRVANPC
jgi:hypothetical protein